jgi:hypothetical protein
MFEFYIVNVVSVVFATTTTTTKRWYLLGGGSQPAAHHFISGSELHFGCLYLYVKM